MTDQTQQVIHDLETRRRRMVFFTNITDKAFEHTWNGQVHTFQPKKTYKIEFFKANLFSKHLENKLFNAEGLSIIDEEDESDFPTDARRQTLRKQIITGDAADIMQEVVMEEIELPKYPISNKKAVKKEELKEEVSEEFKE